MFLTLKVILTIVAAVLGPVICYIVVYGFSFLLKYIILLIKANRFQKKIKKLNSKSNIDENFEELENVSENEI